MKQRSDCYFCSNCACKSHSKLPSIQQLIAKGEQIDEQYFSNLPSRERKLLQTLMRNNEAYDNLRNRLVSVGGGSDQIRSEYKIPLYIDRSCSCCNYCSCYSKPMINRNIKKYLVQPHHLHQPKTEKYTKASPKRFGLRNHIAIRRIHSDPKNIYSEPVPCLCNSLLTYSSNAFIKEHAIKGDRLGTSGLNKSHTGPKSRSKKVSHEDKFQPNRIPIYKKALFSLRLKNQGDRASKKQYLGEKVPSIARENPFDDEISVHVPAEYEPYEYRQKKRVQYSKKSESYKKLLKPVSSKIYLNKIPINTQEDSIRNKTLSPLMRKNVRSAQRLNKNIHILKKNTMIPLEKKNDAIEIAQQHSHKYEMLNNSKSIKPKRRHAFAPKDLNVLFCDCGSPIYLQKKRITDPSLTRLAYNKNSSSKLKSFKSPYFQSIATRKKTVLSDHYHPKITESKNSEVARKGSMRGYNAKLIESSHSKNKEKRPTNTYTKSFYELLAPVHNFTKSTSRTRNLKHLTTGKYASSICVPNICDSYYRFKKKQRRNNKRFCNRSISTEKNEKSATSMAPSCNCISRNTQFGTAEPVLYNSELKRRRERTKSNNLPLLQAFKIRRNTDFYKHPSTSDIKEKVILSKCHTDSNLTSAKKTRHNKNKRYLSEHSTLQANITDTIKCKSSGIGHILQLLSRPHNHKNKRKRMQRRGLPTTTRQKKISPNPYNKFTKINQLGQEKEDYVTKSILKATKINSDPEVEEYEIMQTNTLRKQNKFQNHDLKKTVSFNSKTGNSPKKSRHSAPNFRKQAKYQDTKYYYLSDNRKEMKDRPYYDLNLKVSQKNEKVQHPTLKCFKCEPGFCSSYQCDPVECIKIMKTRCKIPKQTNTEIPTSNAVGSITRESMQRSKLKKYIQTDSHSELKVYLQPKHVTRFGSNITLRKSGKKLLEQTSKHNTSKSKNYSGKRKQKNNILELAPVSKCQCKKLQQKNSLPHDEDISTGKYEFRKDSKITLKSKRNSYDIPSTTNKKKTRIALDKNQYGSMEKHRDTRITEKNVPPKLLSLFTNSGKFRKLRNLRTNRSTRIVRSQTIPKMPAELEKILMMPPHRRVFTVGSNLHLSIQFYKEDPAASDANEEHSVSRSMSTQQRAPSSFVKGLKSLGALKIFKKSGEKEDKVPKTNHSNESTKEEVTESQIRHDIVKKKKSKSRIKYKKSKGSGQKKVMERSEIHKYEFSEKENISQIEDSKSEIIEKQVKSASLTKFIDKISKSNGKVPHKASDSTYKSQNKNITCECENSALNERKNESCQCEQEELNPNGKFSIGRKSQGRKSEKRRKKYRNNKSLCDVNKCNIQRRCKSKSTKDNTSKISWKSSDYNYDKSTLTKKLDSKFFYECEPHICVPGVCDPNVCFKIFKSKMKRFKHTSVLAKTDVKSKSVGTVVSAYKRCFCLLKLKKGKNIDINKSSKSIKATGQLIYETTNVVRSKKQDKKLSRYFRKSGLMKTKQRMLLKNDSSMETLMPYSKKKFKKSTSHSSIKIPDVYDLILKTNKQGSPYHVSDDHASVEHPDMYNVKKFKHEEKIKIDSKSSKHNNLPRKKLYKYEEKINIDSKSSKHNDLPRKKLYKHEEKIKIDSKSSKHNDLPRKKLYKHEEKIKIDSKSSKHNDLPRKKLYTHEEKIKIDSKSPKHNDLPRKKSYKHEEKIKINSKHNDLPRKRKHKKMDKHAVRISELNIQVASKSSSHDISDSSPKRHKPLKRKGRGYIENPQDAYPDPNTLKTVDIINERRPVDTSKCLQHFNAITKSVRTGLINLPFGFLKILKFMKKDQESIIKIQSKHLLQADEKLNFQCSHTVCLTTCAQPVTTAARSLCKSAQNVCDNIACLKIKDNINRKSFNTNIQPIEPKKNSKSIQICCTTSRNQIKDKPAPDMKLSVCEYKKVNNNANSAKFGDKKKIKLESLPSCARNHIQPKSECCVSRPKSVPGFFKCFYRKKNVPLTKQECPICMKDILFNARPSTCSNFASAGTKCIKSESEIKKVCKKKTREKENKNVKVKPSPLFDMIVDAKTMKVTNKDEIYRTLGTNRCGPIAKQNLKKSSKNKMPSVIDLVIDRDSANVLNCEQMYWALDNTRKRNKKSAFTLKNEMAMNQPWCRHLQKDKTPCQACINATPQYHSNHCTCCFCSNDAEVRKQHHPQNCTCCICRYGCRYSIKGRTIDIDKYGIKGRSIGLEKKHGTESRTKLDLIAQKNEEERLKMQEPGIIANLSSGVQNLAKQLCVRPCYCGQKICAKIGQARKAKVPPPCVCGSTICKRKYTRKTPYYRNKEEKKKMNAKKKKQRREQLRKESLARINRYAKKDAAMRRKIKRQDQKAMKELEKYINHPEASSWALLGESASDVGRFGINTVSNMLTSFKRGICHPRDIHNRVKLARAHPRAAVAKAWQNFRGSGLSGTVARVSNRCAAMQTSQYLLAQVEANPITNYLFHFRTKDPKERLLKRKPEIEPEPYKCSAYLRSLRKKPCMWLYRLCPWFYPHCLSLLSFWRQFTDVILFILAVGIWSPCILLTEFCRSLMCCFMCAGGG